MDFNEHFTYKKLIKFTIPSIITMIFTSLYYVVDGFFVSNCVGSDAFASVNLIFPPLMILGAIGFMVGTGGSALVSKTLGENKQKEADEFFSLLIYFNIVFGIILAVLGFIFIRPIATFLKAEGDLLEGCVLYGRLNLITLTPFVLQNCFQSFFIVAGKPKLGLKFSICSGILNMIGDLVFVYFLNWGLLGAGIATGLGETFGGVVPLIYFFNKKNDSNIHLGKTKFDIKVLLKSSSNGFSEMLTDVSMSLVNMLYNFQLMRLIGSDGVAAYGIIMYVSYVFISLYIGYAVGVAPLVGYNYGAQNTDELKSLLKKSLRILFVCAISVFIISELLSKVLATIFVSYDKELLKLTTNAFRIYFIAFLFNGFNIFGSSFFTALNNGFVSAIISFFRTLVMQVIMVIVLPMIFGVNGIWFSIVIAEFVAVCVTSLLILLNKNRYNYI